MEYHSCSNCKVELINKLNRYKGPNLWICNDCHFRDNMQKRFGLDLGNDCLPIDMFDIPPSIFKDRY